MPNKGIRFETAGAHGQDTSIGSATPIAVPDGATHVLISATTQAIRLTLDGTTPTGSKGIHIAAADPPVLLPVPTGGTLNIIEEAASAVADWQFLRQV